VALRLRVNGPVAVGVPFPDTWTAAGPAGWPTAEALSYPGTGSHRPEDGVKAPSQGRLVP
jgi:hypothetical protein